MLLRAEITGLTALLCHNGATGLDQSAPQRLEINRLARRKASDRTTSDDSRIRELECQLSLYINSDGRATIPAANVRACIERAARKLRQGPMVREGLIIASEPTLGYDTERYGTTMEELGRTTQFTVPVRVGQSRLLRTRARFADWSLSFDIETDEELVDESKLRTWFEIAGRRIGLGDWRPEKSGHHGRFELASLTEL